MEKIGAHDECDAPHQPDHDASGGLSRIFSGPVGCFHCHGGSGSLEQDGPLAIVAMKKEK